MDLPAPNLFEDIPGLPIPDIVIMQNSVVNMSPIIPNHSPVPNLVSLCANMIAKQSNIPSLCKYLPEELKKTILIALEKQRNIPDDNTLNLLLPCNRRCLDLSNYPSIQSNTINRLLVYSKELLSSLILDGIQIERKENIIFDFSNIHFPKLQKISLNQTNITTNIILPIIQSSSNLISLSVQKCKYVNMSEIFKTLSVYCNSIKELKIGDNSNIIESELIQLVENIDLISLDIRSSSSWLSQDALKSMIPCCKNLKQLNMNEFYPLRDDVLIEIASTCSQLKSLSLVNCWNISDDSIIDISSKCKHMEELILDGCSSLSDKSFTEIADNLSLLRNLSFVDCELVTSEAKDLLTSKCSHLQQFEITESNISMISLSNCHDLREIKLKGNIHSFRSSSILELSKNCPMIHTISIENNRFLDSSTVLSIVKNWNTIKSLTLNNCLQLDDCAVLAIAKYCINLEELNLFGGNFSSKTFTSLISNLKQLKTINFGGCKKLSDDNLLLLGSNCPRLTSLNISGCTRLSTFGIEQFVKLSKNIQKFYTSDISNSVIQELLECYNLRSLSISNGTKLSDNYIEMLSELSCLRYLSIGHCKLSNNTVSNLVNKLQLEELRITDCPTITNDILPYLAYQSNCDSIHITGSQISPTKAKEYSLENKLHLIASAL